MQALSETKKLYQFVINNIHAAVVVHGADTKVICSNAKAQELLGLTEAQMLGNPVLEFLRPDKKKMPVDEYPVNQVLAAKRPVRDFLFGLHHPLRKEVLWVLVYAEPVFDNNGIIQQVIVTYFDTTERKHIEESLKKQALTLNNILEKAADGICVCHNIPEAPYVRFTLWNPGMTNLTGYTIDEINKFGWYQTVYPDPEVRQEAIKKMAGMRAGEDLFFEEWVITTKDGDKKPLSISTSIIKRNNGEVHVLAIMRDISKRKQAEMVLRESQRKYQNIIEKSDDIIWTTDLNINTIYVSPSVEKKLGFTPDERMAQSLEAQVPPESYKIITECLAQELTKEQDKNVDPDRIIRMEVEYYHKNGSILWFENIASGIRDENGALVGVHGISRDITDKKLAVEALRESENKFKLLAEHSADVIYKLNIETEQCTYVSPAIEALLGYTVQECLCLSAQDILTAESYAKQRERFFEALQSGYQNSGALELEGIHKSGHTVPIEINAGFLFDKQGKPVEILGVARDITRRKKAEQALMAEKNKLQAALLEIKKLSGMLPICASCKKIRDDKGYWNQLETYITEHSEAQFSHSICPKCAKKLYPEFHSDNE